MPRILIIEDDLHIRVLLSLVLESEGYECISATDGEEGLHAQQVAKADLIILDYLLPGLSGAEVFEMLRARGDQTPVLFLSADREIERKTHHCRPCRVIRKPFEVDKLLGTIQAFAGPGAPQTLEKTATLLAEIARLDFQSRRVAR